MNPKEICDCLRDQLNIPLEWVETKADPFANVSCEHWKTTCQATLEEPFSLTYLRSLTGVDRPEENEIEVVAHLMSYRHCHGFVLKTRTQRDTAQLESIASLWPAANWYEREIFDLLGVSFIGHPNLQRLLLPRDWVGHPLRKDYQEQTDYNGIPTVRPGYEKVLEIDK